MNTTDIVSGLRRQLLARIEEKTAGLQRGLELLAAAERRGLSTEMNWAIAQVRELLALEADGRAEMTEAEWQEHLRDLDSPGEPHDSEWTEEDERDYQQTLRDDAAHFRRER
jgi:hypothetical protein